MSEKQWRHRIAEGIIPSFKMGGTICALRSKLNDWLAAQAEGGSNG